MSTKESPLKDFLHFRVCVGWIGDRKWINRIVLQGCGGILAASLTLVSLLFDTFPLLAAYEGLYGASTGIEDQFHSGLKNPRAFPCGALITHIFPFRVAHCSLAHALTDPPPDPGICVSCSSSRRCSRSEAESRESCVSYCTVVVVAVVNADRRTPPPKPELTEARITAGLDADKRPCSFASCPDRFAFSSFLAIFVALHGSVIVDVFTIERVDLGVGMTMLSSGLAGFVVLPLAGEKNHPDASVVTWWLFDNRK